MLLYFGQLLVNPPLVILGYYTLCYFTIGFYYYFKLFHSNMFSVILQHSTLG
jgi:hypothetical protein